MDDVDRIVAGLSQSDQDLLCERCDGWGSWMWSAGNRLVSMGLGTRTDTSIRFDTPLALAVRARLAEVQSHD